MGIRTDISFLTMEEELRVGVRLHRRLFGQNDVLDHELNYKVGRIMKEKKRKCSQLETDMDFLKSELSKTSISPVENLDRKVEHVGIKDLDKPSAVVLRARMMLKSAKPIIKRKECDREKNRVNTPLPRSFIRLQDLPRLRYEKLKKTSAISKIGSPTKTDTLSDDSLSVSSGFNLHPNIHPRRRSSLPSLSTQKPEDFISTNDYKYLRRLGSVQNLTTGASQVSQSFRSPQIKRRLSVYSDLNTESVCVHLNVPTPIQRPHSSPNCHINVSCFKRKNDATEKTTSAAYQDRITVPSNSERRIQLKKSSAFQIYKYLADVIPNMSNQELADIQKQRQNPFKYVRN